MASVPGWGVVDRKVQWEIVLHQFTLVDFNCSASPAGSLMDLEWRTLLSDYDLIPKMKIVIPNIIVVKVQWP